MSAWGYLFCAAWLAGGAYFTWWSYRDEIRDTHEPAPKLARKPLDLDDLDRRCGGAACPVLQSPPAPPYGPNRPWSEWEQQFDGGAK